MALDVYSTVLASESYIHIGEDGGVEAGMILQDGSVLKANLVAGSTQTEVRKNVRNLHNILTLQRTPEGIVRSTTYFGMRASVQLFRMPTNGKDCWLGGEPAA